jgi:hypothetical protein
LQVLFSPSISPLLIATQTQSLAFMDLDVGEDLTMPIPSLMEVGDFIPKCNILVVPSPSPHQHTQHALKQDL